MSAARPQCIVDADARETGRRFLDIPERWLDDPHWRCDNGHVRTMYIKSESRGGGICPVCQALVWITFPEDVDGPTPTAPTTGEGDAK